MNYVPNHLEFHNFIKMIGIGRESVKDNDADDDDEIMILKGFEKARLLLI